MLDYVPCQTIQDRRACYYIQKNRKSMSKILKCYNFYMIDVDNSIFRLWNEYKFYIGMFIKSD
jgi:hypothetical protein